MSKSHYEPMSGRDAWFLYAEKPNVPLDIGTVYIFEPESRFPGGTGAQGIEETVRQRLHLVPRYRQKVKRVPLNLSHPVWVDDADFDLGYHVRREVLPPPGDGVMFRDTVARILSRPMDMRRPLWEMTLVTGLRNGQVALLNRAHHAMVDGVSSADILTLLLDVSSEPAQIEAPSEPWLPRPAPTSWELVQKKLINLSPNEVGATRRVRRNVRNAFRQPWGRILAFGASTFRPQPKLFFNRRLGLQRTGRGVKVPLHEVRALKNRLACTVNDAVLGIIAEGLHRWLVERGEQPPQAMRCFCPVSVRDESERNKLGNRISGMVVDLPIGAITMEERLRLISQRTAELKRSGQAIAADRLAALADWAPSTLMVLAGHFMANQQGGANLNVTNVPGPQFPLYSGGAQLVEVWPFAPLYPGMGVGIAVVSYDGNLYFGFTADPSVVPDMDVFTRHIKDASISAAALAA
jgi:WS/DGAT/MGAT family acyltransferase